MDYTYFSPDYFIARARFTEAALTAGCRVESLDIRAKGPAGRHLAIDIGWFGAEKPERALLHSSGIHGVEGFAGSAIQLQLLANLPRLAPDAALVIVHVLNPYGMSWLRRVNENNVDLNRNCLKSGEHKGAPDAYSKLNSFLNPPSPPSRDLFLLKAALLLLRHGMPSLKQAVVGGQYEYPAGLFFGGRRREEGIEKFQAFIQRRLGSLKKLVVIDVHTGLGRYGEDSLLVDAKDFARLRPIFGERVKPLDAEQGPAYKVRGGLPSVFARLTDTDISFIGQEFGTYGPIKVLHSLREENRWHHHGDATVDHAAKTNIKEVFCPDDPAWRLKVLRRGAGLLEQAIDYGMLCASFTTGGNNATYI